MKTPSILLLSAMLACPAFADLTVTQQIKQEGAMAAASPMPEMSITMKIKGDKMRMDGLPQMSSIVDLKTGDITTLIHAQKAIMTIPGATMKSMQTAKAAGTPQAEVPKATGKKETINGFACEEYETTAGEAKMKVWITKDIPAAEKIMNQVSEISGDSNPLGSVMKKNNITGFPMRTIIELPGSGTTTVNVLSLNEDPIPAADFELPKDYKTMPLPTMPDAPAPSTP